MDIEFILNDALNKALITERIKPPFSSNKISEFVSGYIKDLNDSINEITDKEVQSQLCFLSGVSNSLSKVEYQKLVNDFLVHTEEEDKTKPNWQTRNNVPILHNSLNKFYIWLCKNYW